MSQKPRILLSAGHNTLKQGKENRGFTEFRFTKKILELVVGHISKLGVEHKAVPIDMELLNRIDWINKSGYLEEDYDLLVEFHINDGNKTGIETWYFGDDNDSNYSKKFAEFVGKEFSTLTGYKNNGIKNEKDSSVRMLILRETKVIAITVELFYLDNDEDRKILEDDKKLDEACKNIAIVIDKYIKVLNEDKLKLPKKEPKKTVSTFDGLGGFGSGMGFDSGMTRKDPFGMGGFGDTFSSINKPDDSSTKSSSVSMDREARKKMINEAYEKYLDTEPKQMDLNTYLNTAISEDDLLKKIIKSKEHEQMVSDFKEYKNKKSDIKKMEIDLVSLNSQVEDFKKMIVNFQRLLEHKNRHIKHMHDELVRREVIKNGQYYNKESLALSSQDMMKINTAKKPKKKGIFGL